MEDKGTTLGALSAKYRCVQALILRNREKKGQKQVKFPFLIVEPSPEPDTDIFIKMQSDLLKTLIISNKNLNMYGDLEIINLIPSLTNQEGGRGGRQESLVDNKLRI